MCLIENCSNVKVNMNIAKRHNINGCATAEREREDGLELLYLHSIPIEREQVAEC